MDPLLISLRILHIVFGVFWVGTGFFIAMILQPRLQTVSPTIRAPVMAALLPTVGLAVTAAGVVVIGTGTAIALILRWRSLDTFLSSGWGWAILVGFVAAVIGFILGAGFSQATGRRFAKLVRGMQGRAPAPEEAQELGRLAGRLRLLVRTTVVFGLIAVGSMAAARFV